MTSRFCWLDRLLCLKAISSSIQKRRGEQHSVHTHKHVYTYTYVHTYMSVYITRMHIYIQTEGEIRKRDTLICVFIIFVHIEYT